MSGRKPTSIELEYETLRSGRACFELAGWSSVAVTGTDRKTFLNNFCTNDVKQVAPGANREAFFTNVKGKIVGHGVIHCRDTELLIVGPPGQATKLIEHLDRYIIRDDVQLTDNSETRRYVFVVNDVEGPAGSILWDLVGRGNGRILEVPVAEASALGAILAEQRFLLVGGAAFTMARIEAGVPLFGVDFDGDNLPQEVGRDKQAISFTKGCYLGQETVARIDALGHVNQKLAGVKFAGSNVPDAGMVLTRGNEVGRVTSATWSPALKSPLALAMVRREANAVGTRLDSTFGEAEVVSLPLVGVSKV